MQHRKPYQLKEYIVIYNVCQLIACAYFIKTVWADKEAPPIEYFSRCQVFQSFRNPTDLYKFTCFLYVLKLSEMSETVVFVLRKKWQQISFLHVFHHCAMLVLVFLGGNSGCSKFYHSIIFDLKYKFIIFSS